MNAWRWQDVFDPLDGAFYGRAWTAVYLLPCIVFPQLKEV